MEVADTGRWIDAKEVARQLGVSRATIYSLVKAGKLRNLAFGPAGSPTVYRFRIEWVEAFIESMAEKPKRGPEVQHEWIDAKVAAEMLGVNRTTVYMLARSGRIRSMTFTSPDKRRPRYRFRREWIAEFVAKHTNEPRD